MCKKRKENSSSGSGTNGYQRIIVICVVTLFFVFIILPGLFLLLGAVFPSVFSGTVALRHLQSNISYLVGIVSLVLGGFSIHSAKESDRRMAEQRQEQKKFLEETGRKVEEVKSGLERLHYDNEKIKEKLYDIVNKKSDVDLSSDRATSKDSSCEQETSAVTKKDESQ